MNAVLRDLTRCRKQQQQKKKVLKTGKYKKAQGRNKEIQKEKNICKGRMEREGRSDPTMTRPQQCSGQADGAEMCVEMGGCGR